VGYGRKNIAQAVYDQICDLPYFTSMQFSNMPAIKLAEVPGEIAPGRYISPSSWTLNMPEDFVILKGLVTFT